MYIRPVSYTRLSQAMLSHCCRSLLAALLFAAWPVVAQEEPGHPFYPLGIGDTWEHVVYLFEEGYSFRQTNVLRDTTIGGEAYALVEVIDRTLALETTSEELCATRYDSAEQAIEWVSINGTCDPYEDNRLYEEIDFGTLHAGAEEVAIGGTTYGLDLLSYAEWADGVFHRYQFAEGMGLVSLNGASGGGFPVISVTLVHAVVGGETFGMPPEEHEWASFLPLEVGDVWVFNSRREGGPEGGPDRYATVYTSIEGDTTIAGEPFVVAVESQFDPESGDLMSTGRYAMRVQDGRLERVVVQALDDGLQSVWIFLEYYPRLYQMMDLRLYQRLRLEATVQVGSELYAADVLTFSYDTAYDGSGGSVVARDIGLVELSHRLLGQPSSLSWFTYLDLLAARVGGVVYGNQILVTNEASAVAPDAFLLSEVYPSPFSSTVTLTLNLQVAEIVSLEVFDVLGRRVLRRDLGEQSPGDAPHTIGGSSWAPGVYFVRATTASGKSAAYRVVKVD